MSALLHIVGDYVVSKTTLKSIISPLLGYYFATHFHGRFLPKVLILSKEQIETVSNITWRYSCGKYNI